MEITVVAMGLAIMEHIDYEPQPIDFNSYDTIIDTGSYTFDIESTDE